MIIVSYRATVASCGITGTVGYAVDPVAWIFYGEFFVGEIDKDNQAFLLAGNRSLRLYYGM